MQAHTFSFLICTNQAWLYLCMYMQQNAGPYILFFLYVQTRSCLIFTFSYNIIQAYTFSTLEQSFLILYVQTRPYFLFYYAVQAHTFSCLIPFRNLLYLSLILYIQSRISLSLFFYKLGLYFLFSNIIQVLNFSYPQYRSQLSLFSYTILFYTLYWLDLHFLFSPADQS